MRWFGFVLPAALAAAVSACAPGFPSPEDRLAAETAPENQALNLSPAGFAGDLTTPAGIKVKTNGQYETHAARKSAAATIDRYWNEVRKCAAASIPPGNAELSGRLITDFPRHLSVEIASNWKIVAGPATHRMIQAFPSPARPGAWATARREEKALHIYVVPELVGLGSQMAGELNPWLAGNTGVAPVDLSTSCSQLACYRFSYDNAPSQAWDNCVD